MLVGAVGALEVGEKVGFEDVGALEVGKELGIEEVGEEVGFEDVGDPVDGEFVLGDTVVGANVVGAVGVVDCEDGGCSEVPKINLIRWANTMIHICKINKKQITS
jgi:hypothetical protein